MHNLYLEQVLDHSRYPRNAKPLARFSYSKIATNRSCGDKAEVQLLVENGLVIDVAFIVSGCALACAGGSVLSELVENKKLPLLIKPPQIYSALGIEAVDRVDCLLLALYCLEELDAEAVAALKQVNH